MLREFIEALESEVKLSREALESLLFRRFKNEAASHMPHRVFIIACEDEDLITEEEIKMLSEFATEYENYKTSARG